MNVVLCVTGSVAAVEAVKLARELKRHDIHVKCFMSDAACEIIHPHVMEFATGEEVVLGLTGQIEHVKYAQADLILVAPATANVISKLTYKIADNPISTLLVTAFGYETPIVFVPSMHQPHQYPASHSFWLRYPYSFCPFHAPFHVPCS